MTITTSLAVALIAVIPVSISAQQLDGELRQVPIGDYVSETFWIVSTSSEESLASRINLDMTDKQDNVPAPSPGYVFSSRILVETSDLSFLGDFAHGIDSTVEVLPLEFLAGFAVINTSSVGAACDMASALAEYYGPRHAYVDVDQPKFLRALPNDPGFGNQWHLYNVTRPQADINAEPAWNNGFTGSGITVGILEWGVQDNHPDLAANFDSTASQSAGTSSHGTSCAGVAAAVENNGAGGVGIAYDAHWSEQLAGSSSQTANAFNYRNDINDVKSNSWGPADNGNFHTFSTTELNALKNSTSTGRGGLGEIFTWAAGNGGTSDRVEYDPYAASRYTIAVGAIGDQDKRASYNEQGSSMFVVAQSSGNISGIYTTTSGSGYTFNFGGTSSASPLGAGAVALILQANPTLSWLDVQHVLVHSARMCDPTHSMWIQNAAGHDVNYNFGFGAIDADASTQLAQSWTNVIAVTEFNSGNITVGQSIPDNNTTGVSRTVSVPQNITVEHVELVMDVSHNNIGDLRITITSPGGTECAVAKTGGSSQNNLNNYLFTSVRTWDEQSSGDWVITVSDRSGGTSGVWNDFSMKIYGNDGSHLGGGGNNFKLTTSGLIAGSTAVLNVTGGGPNTPTWIGYSITGLGSTSVPNLGVTLDIANAKPLSMTPNNTNANGDASWFKLVPGSASGVAVWLQALQFGATSTVLAETIQ